MRPAWITRIRGLAGDVWYERRYGVRTAEPLRLDVHNDENIYYAAANRRHLHRALPVDEVTERDVFIDLGSGKGRMVLEAAGRYPFARVIGVELSEELHELGRRNVELASRRLRCRDVRLVRQDLRDYQIPDDVTVIFMHNPVRGSAFAVVFSEISASLKRNPRAMRIIYTNPVEEATILSTGEWQRVRTVASRRAHFPFGVTCAYAHPVTA